MLSGQQRQRFNLALSRISESACSWHMPAAQRCFSNALLSSLCAPWPWRRLALAAAWRSGHVCRLAASYYGWRNVCGSSYQRNGSLKLAENGVMKLNQLSAASALASVTISALCS